MSQRLSASAWAQQTATTEDGKKVLLKKDGTWEYVEDDASEAQEGAKEEKKSDSKEVVTTAKSSAGVSAGRPVVMGALDKNIIRRVVRQHRREIMYCYEKALQNDPDLAGQVKVKFTFAGSGSVIAAMVRSSTLKNRDVESCVTSAIHRWVFPEPKGGGIVVVNYPFNFTAKN